MIRILTPQHKLLGEVENSVVDAFLRTRQLVGKKILSRPELIAFEKSIDISLGGIGKPNVGVIRHFSGDFKKVVHEKLDEGLRVFVVASLRDMREFYSTEGFIRSMEALAKAEAPVEIIIPAGQYGDDHVFAFRRSP